MRQAARFKSQGQAAGDVPRCALFGRRALGTRPFRLVPGPTHRHRASGSDLACEDRGDGVQDVGGGGLDDQGQTAVDSTSSSL